MRAILVVAALLLVLVAAWLAFCFGDWRRGNGICPVHGIAMESVIVHPPAGSAPSFAPSYYDAREKQFPNAPPDTTATITQRASVNRKYCSVATSAKSTAIVVTPLSVAAFDRCRDVVRLRPMDVCMARKADDLAQSAQDWDAG